MSLPVERLRQLTPLLPVEGNLLSAELTCLDWMLQRQVLRLRLRHQFVESEFRGTFIPDEQVDALLRERSSSQASEGNGDLPLGELSRQIEALQEGIRQAGDRSPLNRLGRLFGLDEVERHLLLVALAPALDLRYETVYAYVQNDVNRRQPTLDLALKLLFDSLAGRVSAQRYADPDAPLLRYRLLHLAPDPQDAAPTIAGHYLKIDPRLVAWLAGGEGMAGIDSRLRLFARLLPVGESPESLPLEEDGRLELHGALRFLARSGGMVFLHGPPGAGKEEAAAGLAAGLGLRLLSADLRLLLAGGLPLEDGLDLLQREALLQGALLYLAECDTLAEHPGLPACFARRLGDLHCPVIVGSLAAQFAAETWPQTPFIALRLELPPPSRRLALWRQALAGVELDPHADLEGLADRFRLGAQQINEAARFAAAQAEARPTAYRMICQADLYQAARLRSSQALGELAQKIDARRGLEDILLPPASHRQLDELLGAIRHRQTVHAAWGFAERLALPGGVSALFYGPSGTGKTLAAEILAYELGLELYRIDLSGVVSKYIGETEKNLGRIFAAAEDSNAILFFDEADALFGKRSEVRDSHDRYANLEVAYLLQKMETYRGIAILATNLRGNMDEAFARRLGYTVEFPLPDAGLRQRLWQAMFPEQAPLAQAVDFSWLARQFELSGGNIRNAALSAAFLAAESGGEIDMRCLVLGVARELQKTDRLPTRAAFGEYYHQVLEHSQAGGRR